MEQRAGIIDLAAWRAEHAAGDELDGVEAAIARLDRAMDARGWRIAPPWVLTEVRAIQGCLALGEMDEAVERADRLTGRLTDAPRRRRAGR